MDEAELPCSEEHDVLLGELMDDYLQRLADGEHPEIELYAKAHPHIASIIRQTFPPLRIVNESVPLGPKEDATLSPHKQLGDFQLVRQIGSGGMGVVYEAEQLSMGRRVALKILPMIGTLQPKSLQRFRNEVRAAAMFDHPNIVSIYSVGEERGVHYYAMQLIRGQSLADVIRHLTQLRRSEQPLSGDSFDRSRMENRQSNESPVGDVLTEEYSADDIAAPSTPTAVELRAGASTRPRTETKVEFWHAAARLIAQAAMALQHAHDQGVLHRDIKPANLLLDPEGNLYVTDFGLARIEAGAGMTVTGDIVGTLRYMSPEQAHGKRVVVDHRADIYSLGATLYELLTLRPVFNGASREELFKQVAFEEPPKPRSIDRAIPRDLETIVLRAIAKNPAERYDTAEQLAKDLRAYIDGRPILAKRPTFVEHVHRFERKHRKLIVTAVLSTIAALAVSTGLIYQSYRRAVSERQRAESEHDRANKNFELAMNAMDELYAEFIPELELRGVPELGSAARLYIDNALPFYRQFAEQNRSEEALNIRVAKAYRIQGEFQEWLGEHEQSIHSLSQSVSLLEKLLERHPKVEDYRYQLAVSHGNLAKALIAINRESTAAPHARASAKLLDELTREFPENLQYEVDLITTYDRLAHVHQGNDQLAESERYFRRAIAAYRHLLSDRVDEFAKLVSGDRALAEAQLELFLAGELHNLALLEDARGRPLEAMQLLLEAIRYTKASVDKAPARHQPRRYLQNHLRILSDLYHKSGEDRLATETLKEMTEQTDWLVANSPSMLPNRLFAASAHFDLAVRLNDASDFDAAERHYRRCLAILEEVSDEDSDEDSQEWQLRHQRARGLYNLARLCALTERPAEARKAWESSLADWRQLAIRFKGTEDFPECKGRVGASLHNLGVLSYQEGDWQDAREKYREALTHQEEALLADPAYAMNQQHMLNHLSGLVRVSLELNDYRDVERYAEQLLQRAGDDPEYSRYVADAYTKCAELVEGNAQLSEAERKKLVMRYDELANNVRNLKLE